MKLRIKIQKHLQNAALYSSTVVADVMGISSWTVRKPIFHHLEKNPEFRRKCDLTAPCYIEFNVGASKRKSIPFPLMFSLSVNELLKKCEWKTMGGTNE